jgi:hypothetical protein
MANKMRSIKLRRDRINLRRVSYSRESRRGWVFGAPRTVLAVTHADARRIAEELRIRAVCPSL